MRVTAKAGTWSSKTMLDDSHTELEVLIPPGINESEVTVIAEFCDNRGEPIASGVVLKEPVEQPKPESEQPRSQPRPQAQPPWQPRRKSKPEPKSEVTPEAPKSELRDQEIAQDERPTEQPIAVE
jgi:hypothetical protein